MVVKSWFLKKNLGSEKAYSCKIGDLSIEKETEKAVFIKCSSEFGEFAFWCPKSCVELNKTYDDLYEEQAVAYENGKQRWQKAYDFAIQNGLKIRNNLKLNTILAKIKEAGLDY